MKFLTYKAVIKYVLNLRTYYLEPVSVYLINPILSNLFFNQTLILSKKWFIFIWNAIPLENLDMNFHQLVRSPHRSFFFFFLEQLSI